MADASGFKRDHERDDEPLDLRVVADALLRRIWVVVACVVAAVATAVAVSATQPEPYSSSAALIVRYPTILQRLGGERADLTLPTGARELSTRVAPIIEQRTADALGEPPALVTSAIDVATAQDSGLVTVTAEGVEPATAAVLARTYAGELVALGRERDRLVLRQARRAATSPRALREIDALKASGFRTVELLRPASQAAPVERRIVSNGVLAGLVALLAALGLVFVLERLSRR